MSGFAGIWQLGPRITAAILGLPFTQYRPASNSNAIAEANLVGTVPVWITGDSTLKALKPLNRKDPTAYAGVDPALVQAGDYLVGPLVYGDQNETFFVASRDVPMPITVVRCNEVITIERPSDGAVGTTFYSGDPQNNTTMVTAWPAAILSDRARGMSEADLPGDVPLGFANVWLPVSLPASPRASDVILMPGGLTNSVGAPVPDRLLVMSAELTAFGWRLSCRVETP